jgi:hypothetical protein
VSVLRNVLTPKVPAAAGRHQPAITYLVELLLRRDGSVVDRNVYWLSTRPDVVDWPRTVGNPQATMTEYANFHQLQSLPGATVTAAAHTMSTAGVSTTSVTIANTSDRPIVSLFLRADVRRGTPSGSELPGDNEVLPITWTSNDVTLWPGESTQLIATYATSQLDGSAPVVRISGWNVGSFDVPG